MKREKDEGINYFIRDKFPMNIPLCIFFNPKISR